MDFFRQEKTSYMQYVMIITNNM